MGVPILSTGIAYHLQIKGQVSHSPSSNFNVSHHKPLEFDSTEAGRGVHNRKKRERRGRKRMKILTLEHIQYVAQVCKLQAKQWIAACSSLPSFPLPPPPSEERMSKEMLNKLCFWKSKTQPAQDVDLQVGGMQLSRHHFPCLK